MPPPLTPQYLTILMTERGDAIIFCRILAPPPPPPMTSPPPPDCTILNYLTDRKGGARGITFCRILAPPNAPPPSTPQYFNYLNNREGGDAIIFCWILASPPSPDATILKVIEMCTNFYVVIEKLPPKF